MTETERQAIGTANTGRKYKVHTPTRPRGSWRWQDAIAVYVVECPTNEQPDLRRRNHRLTNVIARKVAYGTRATMELISHAEKIAKERNEEACRK